VKEVASLNTPFFAWKIKGNHMIPPARPYRSIHKAGKMNSIEIGCFKEKYERH